jgi:hypothetical protein
MQLEIIDASHTVNETGTTWGKRQSKIAEIFYNNLAALEGMAFYANPQLTHEDAKSIMRRLRKRMGQYIDRPDRFLGWARRFVKNEARLSKNQAIRAKLFEAIYADSRCRGAIMNGVREGLTGATIDAAIEDQDVYNEVLLRVFVMAGKLSKPSSTANLRTRLRGLARRHALSYFTLKRNRRRKSMAEHIASGGGLGCEFLTEEELASMRADDESDGK